MLADPYFAAVTGAHLGREPFQPKTVVVRRSGHELKPNAESFVWQTGQGGEQFHFLRQLLGFESHAITGSGTGEGDLPGGIRLEDQDAEILHAGARGNGTVGTVPDAQPQQRRRT